MVLSIVGSPSLLYLRVVTELPIFFTVYVCYLIMSRYFSSLKIVYTVVSTWNSYTFHFIRSMSCLCRTKTNVLHTFIGLSIVVFSLTKNEPHQPPFTPQWQVIHILKPVHFTFFKVFRRDIVTRILIVMTWHINFWLLQKEV